jgi:hypothetical protein
MHQNILAVLYYTSSLITSLILLYTKELHFKSLGVMLMLYTIYMVVSEYERLTED